MKRIALLFTLLAIFFTSCSKEGESTSGSENQTVESAAESVQSAGDTAANWTRSAGYWMADTWDSIAETSAASSAKVKETLQEASNRLGKQIDAAQVAATKLTGAAKEQVEKGIVGLQQAREEIVEAGSRISDASAEQWPELQREIGEAWNQAGQSMQSIWEAASGSNNDESVSAPAQ